MPRSGGMKPSSTQVLRAKLNEQNLGAIRNIFFSRETTPPHEKINATQMPHVIDSRA